MDKITNIEVKLGARIIMVGGEILGTIDNISLDIAESTTEEMEKLESAYEIRLVKMPGEGGGV